MDDAELVARLSRRGNRYDDGAMMHGELINPDGPAAIACIEALTAKAEALVEALQVILGPKESAGTWMDIASPLIARFDIAAKFNVDAVHNGTGADAIAKLMTSMAGRLDRAVAIARAALKAWEDTDAPGDPGEIDAILTSYKTGLEEGERQTVEKIVAWLRMLAILRAMQNPGQLADAIERGDHKDI